MATTQDQQNGATEAHLGPKAEAVALALARGRSYAEAAAEACVGVSTIKRWASEGAFARRVRAIRSELTNQALGRLSAAMSRAADAMLELLESNSPQVRLGAAKAIFENGIRLREQTDVAARLDALEQRAKGYEEDDR